MDPGQQHPRTGVMAANFIKVNAPAGKTRGDAETQTSMFGGMLAAFTLIQM